MRIRDLKTKQLVILSMFIAIGVVISPILRVEGYAPMQHFINIVVSVFMGPWVSLLCAVMIAFIRMITMSIPPLALTGAVFGAFLSGYLYEKSGNKLIFAWIGEIIGTGIIGSIISYPVMHFIMGRGELSWFFYTPSFTIATIMGGGVAMLFLLALKKNKLFDKIKVLINE